MLMPHEPGGARLAARASISGKTNRHTDTVKGQKKDESYGNTTPPSYQKLKQKI